VNEDPTQDMPDARSFEERVFARFDAIDARLDAIDERITNAETRLYEFGVRLTSLEEKVDRRLQDTRPIWEAVQEQLKNISTKFDVVILDLYETRTALKDIDKRVTNLENSRPQ
jgi:hypothetical protein